MRTAIALLTLASFGGVLAVAKTADPTNTTAKTKKHKKHGKGKTDTTAPASTTK